MRALTFWKTVTVDRTNLLESLLSLLAEYEVQYCVIGGQAINAYAEPVVSLDLDIVVAADQLDRIESLLQEHFTVASFPHSINVSLSGSDLRVQIQTDPRYLSFLKRASLHDILGLTLPVAAPEDVLQGKLWAAVDPERRASKRQKDLADIARLLEAFPNLRDRVPAEVREHLL
jgi:hypothetical protein